MGLVSAWWNGIRRRQQAILNAAFPDDILAGRNDRGVSVKGYKGECQGKGGNFGIF